MKNERTKLAEKSNPVWRELASRLNGDLIQLTYVVETVKPAVLDDELIDSYVGTFRGNSFLIIRGCLLREAAAIVSRLFAKPRYQNKSLDIRSSDYSFCLAAELAKNDRHLRHMMRRDFFRAGAAGSYAIIENDRSRERTLWETLRDRIRSGIETRERKTIRLNDALSAVLRFTESQEYKRIRIFRTENIAHNLPESAERIRFDLSTEDSKLSLIDLIDISLNAASIAEEAYLAFFEVALSLEDLRSNAAEYADDFWKVCTQDGGIAD